MKLVKPGTDDGPQVLVVDDYVDVGRALTRLLRRRGVGALLVQNAGAALLALESNLVSVVVADLSMPERDGLSLLAEVGRRWPKAARVLWTGHASSDLILNEHGVRVLSKNLDTALVIDVVLRLHRSFVQDAPP